MSLENYKRDFLSALNVGVKFSYNELRYYIVGKKKIMNDMAFRKCLSQLLAEGQIMNIKEKSGKKMSWYARDSILLAETVSIKHIDDLFSYLEKSFAQFKDRFYGYSVYKKTKGLELFLRLVYCVEHNIQNHYWFKYAKIDVNTYQKRLGEIKKELFELLISREITDARKRAQIRKTTQKIIMNFLTDENKLRNQFTAFLK